MNLSRPGHGYYVLVGQTPVEVDDVLDWARSFEENRRVAVTMLPWGCWVSTVFLGLDHSWAGGPPLLFETMAFWDEDGGDETDRCTTWLQAEAMHERMIKEVSRPAVIWYHVRRLAGKRIGEAIEDLRALLD